MKFTVMTVLQNAKYLEFINNIIDTPENELENYVEKLINEHEPSNPNFKKNLRNCLEFILEGVDKKGDNEIMFENGDFKLEDGDISLTGKQTNLHNALILVHMQVIESIDFPAILDFDSEKELEAFKKKLNPNFKKELEEVRKKIKKLKKNKPFKEKLKDLPVWFKIILALLGIIGTAISIVTNPKVVSLIASWFE